MFKFEFEFAYCPTDAFIPRSTLAYNYNALNLVQPHLHSEVILVKEAFDVEKCLSRQAIAKIEASSIAITDMINEIEVDHLDAPHTNSVSPELSSVTEASSATVPFPTPPISPTPPSKDNNCHQPCEFTREVLVKEALTQKKSIFSFNEISLEKTEKENYLQVQETGNYGSDFDRVIDHEKNNHLDKPAVDVTSAKDDQPDTLEADVHVDLSRSSTEFEVYSHVPVSGHVRELDPTPSLPLICVPTTKDELNYCWQQHRQRKKLVNIDLILQMNSNIDLNKRVEVKGVPLSYESLKSSRNSFVFKKKLELKKSQKKLAKTSAAMKRLKKKLKKKKIVHTASVDNGFFAELKALRHVHDAQQRLLVSTYDHEEELFLEKHETNVCEIHKLQAKEKNNCFSKEQAKKIYQMHDKESYALTDLQNAQVNFLKQQMEQEKRKLEKKQALEIYACKVKHRDLIVKAIDVKYYS
eukprot:Awhi_evm1s1779